MQGLRADAGHLADTLRSSSTEPGGLTRREREIAELVGRGLANRQIADLLDITARVGGSAPY